MALEDACCSFVDDPGLDTLPGQSECGGSSYCVEKCSACTDLPLTGRAPTGRTSANDQDVDEALARHAWHN